LGIQEYSNVTMGRILDIDGEYLHEMENSLRADKGYSRLSPICSRKVENGETNGMNVGE